MFPDAPQNSPTITQNGTVGNTNGDIIKEYVGDVRSQLATLQGEIALRNRVIQQNDAYIYGDLLTRTLDIPVGHDMTPVNWLRRTVEIHRTQFMGKGFTIVSAYQTLDTDTEDPQASQQIIMENKKRKTNAEQRRVIIDSIIRDNGGHSLFAQMAENASAVGFTVLKNWYDSDTGKYVMQIVEAGEHFYRLWKRDNFREWQLDAYVEQISKIDAMNEYGVGPNVATSPLGMPLAVLATANTIEYVSTQPMVTTMQIRGRVQGWSTIGGIHRCAVGEENEHYAVIVGNEVYDLVDDDKFMPEYYVFPNKLVRRRPWGIPDITQAAVNINQTYIETLSDWRTLASKANFPKFKYLNFPVGAQLPQPRARKTEGIPLMPGQDIQPLEMPNSAMLGEKDYMTQMEELMNQFVREVGIGRLLFDTPNQPSANSAQAQKGSNASIGDIVTTKRQLWGPIINKMFLDAFKKLALWDDGMKELYEEDSGWFLRIKWPSAMSKDDPVFLTMLINRFNAGLISIQSFMEAMGETKEELDKIVDEMSQKHTAIIHGHQMPMMAEYMILPPLSEMPPKVNLNLRGDLTPNQVGDIAASRGIVTDQSPFPNTVGPQGNEGLRATDQTMNKGMIQNQKPNEPTSVQLDNTGRPVPPLVAGGANNASQSGQGVGGGAMQTSPQNQQSGQPMINPGGIQGPMAQPGSGQSAASPQGTVAQTAKTSSKARHKRSS